MNQLIHQVVIVSYINLHVIPTIMGNIFTNNAINCDLNGILIN